MVPMVSASRCCRAAAALPARHSVVRDGFMLIFVFFDSEADWQP